MKAVKEAGGEPIRVLVCDDHDLFRKGLRMVLEAEEDIVVVAEAADGEQAVARVEELAPDVVLMDVRMPRMGGIDATRDHPPARSRPPASSSSPSATRRTTSTGRSRRAPTATS